MLPSSSQEKQNATDGAENRATFKYQPNCTLDTDAEKEENEAHLDAHPGNSYVRRAHEAISLYHGNASMRQYIWTLPLRVLELHEVDPMFPDQRKVFDRLDLFRLQRQLKSFEKAEKLHIQKKGREATQAAKWHVNQYRRDKAHLVPVDSKLSTAWSVIVGNLARCAGQDLESDMVSPGSVAGLMAMLSMCCKEMRYLIKAEGFSALGPKVPARAWEDFGVASTAEGELPDVWTRLVKDPHTCQLKELKEIGKQVKIKLTGSKGELVIWLQGYLRISKPMEIPPAVLFSMRWEKHYKCANLGMLRVIFQDDIGRINDCGSAFEGLGEVCQSVAEKGGPKLSVHALLNGRPASQTGRRRAVDTLGEAFPTYYRVRVNWPSTCILTLTPP